HHRGSVHQVPVQFGRRHVAHLRRPAAHRHRVPVPAHGSRPGPRPVMMERAVDARPAAAVTPSPAATTVAKRSPLMRASDVPRFLLLCLLALLFLAPIYWMVTTSLKSEAATVARPIQWWPHQPTLENFKAILESPNAPFARWTFNSLFTSTAFALGSVILAVITAYPL